MSLKNRVSKAWRAFNNREESLDYSEHGGTFNTNKRPYGHVLSFTNEKDIVSSINNRIAVDMASILIRHCRVNENDEFESEIDSELNNRFKWDANKDQTTSAFIQDVALSLFDEGVVAIVPVDTSANPNRTGCYNIYSLRVGNIIEWSPNRVKVNIYDDNAGVHKDIVVDKSWVAIVENPFYAVMNEPNSTLKRLREKLKVLDRIDGQSGYGKIDIFIQGPYETRSQVRKNQAIKRKEEIETQMKGSKYGLAYLGANEKVIQLNRPAENNLIPEIESLTSMAFAQLGLTLEIMNGSANEETMNNYFTRTIEPALSAIVDAMNVKFLTKTARSQKQLIKMFRDPFQLVTVTNLAEVVDKFTRNEVLSSNEFRALIGYRPSSDPRANQLINKNIADRKNGSYNRRDKEDNLNEE